jgi:hypothetical protein
MAMVQPALEPTTPAALREAISAHAALVCTEHYGLDLSALILTGSLARDEVTYLNEDGETRVLGDAEFILIFKEGVRLPHAREIIGIQKEIEGALQKQGIHCQVGLNRSDPGYLRSIRPHIFGYELMTCGKVIAGDADILSLIPRFSAREIPLEDAWRLLQNRMLELLEVSTELYEPPPILPPAVHYRIVKLYLDMATSLLLFAGVYAPSYRERGATLMALSSHARSDDWPFQLREFATAVLHCTEWKLSPDPRKARVGIEFWQQAIAAAHQLWRWELGRLSGVAGSCLSDCQLMEYWSKRQGFFGRLRGWLYVVRREGYLRSWAHWPRWARLAWKASPRYWVYTAGADLMFHHSVPPQDPFLLDVRGRLPALPAGTDDKVSWRSLASEVAWNYQRFLVQTRA